MKNDTESPTAVKEHIQTASAQIDRMNAFEEVDMEFYFSQLFNYIKSRKTPDNKTRVRILSRHGLCTLDNYVSDDGISFFELMQSKIKDGMQFDILLWLSHLDMPIAYGLEDCIRNSKAPEQRLFNRGGYLDVRVAPSTATEQIPDISPFVCIADQQAVDGIFMLCATDDAIDPELLREPSPEAIKQSYSTFYTNNLALAGVGQQVRLFDSVFKQSRENHTKRRSVMRLPPAMAAATR